MSSFGYILLSSFLISLGGLIGIFTLSIQEKKLKRILLGLVALSSGALLGGAFLHLLPEGIERLEKEFFFSLVLAAIVLFFLIEKLLQWRHCHEGPGCGHQRHHMVGYMNLIGDSFHNFIDGLILASTYLISFPLGITATLAIALHEIPQEVGDFGVLLYAGFNKRKALLYNFGVALMVVVGGLTGWFLSAHLENLTAYLLPIAAGGFIYIGASDLLPELRRETGPKRTIIIFGLFLLGIILIYTTKLLD